VVGKTISHYKVIEKIGQGGMGEVYLAQDTALDRKVALKFLPEELQQDSTARKRFLREAKSAAALDHPYICHIHEVGEVEGTSFISMEYVQGETLKDKLGKGPLPLKDALEKATEVAEALEEAHSQGIVHRDLKPSNIMLTPQGHVKVMDFGLAKQVTAVEGEEQEITTALTKQGSTLGTVPYMSPEQVRGQRVDTRSDIFSFGVVLYEMLTGVNPFKRDTSVDTSHAILGETPPPLTRYTEDIPVLLQHTVKKMLAKEPDDRYQLIHDVRTDLAVLIHEIEEVSATPTTVLPIGVGGAAQSLRPGWMVTVGLIVVGAVISGIVVWSLMRASTSTQPPKRFTINLPSTDVLVTQGLALSPEGGSLVYVGRRDGVVRLYRRSMDQLEVSAIEGTENPQVLSISPDGQSLVFFGVGGTTATLNKVSLAGGPIVTLCDIPGRRYGVAWGPDDTIVFGVSDSGLLQVSANGGIPEPVTTLEQGETSHRWPEFLPGGKAVLFTVWSPSTDTNSARIAVQSLETGERRTLLNGTNPRYASTGHIVFAQTSSLWAVPFDLERLEVTGSPVAVIEGVRVNGGGYGQFTIANDGSLAYMPGSGVIEDELVWVDRQGQATPVTETIRRFAQPRLSPDGKYLSVTVGGFQAPDVWIYEIARGTLTPLTFGETIMWPTWTLDGRKITFGSTETGSTGMFSVPADGSGEPNQLTTSEIRQVPGSWSPDGVLVYHERSIPGTNDIWVLPQEGGKAEPFLVTEFNNLQPMFSPDGKWIAFTSDRSGRSEVYVKPYPGEGGIVPISANGGYQPVWARSGKELFYRNMDKMMVVPVQTQPTFKAERPRTLFEGRYEDPNALLLASKANYDVTPDGQQFVMVRPRSARVTQINIVLNWFEELKRLVPTDN